MKKLLEANTSYGRRRVSEVFRDFCELSAISLRNSVDLRGRDDRENRYLQIAGRYAPEEMDRFAEILALLALELERELSDVLGHLYMSLDLGNEDVGQFFTPYEVSKLTARMTGPDIAGRLEGQEFITVSEPACGSGGMVVAMAELMREDGFNYQQQLHVTAQDIEITSVHMSYIALSLLHIPAVIIQGNTLAIEVLDQWFTPAHVLGGWTERLRSRDVSPDVTDEPVKSAVSGPVEVPEEMCLPADQVPEYAN